MTRNFLNHYPITRNLSGQQHSRSIQVVHTIGTLGIKAGGPSRTVPALCQHLVLDRSLSIEINICTTIIAKFGNSVSVAGIDVRDLKTHSTSRLAAELVKCIQNRNNTHPDNNNNSIIHDHGQWLPINRASANVSRRHAIPRVVSPRGMLSPWAMQHRRLKKWVGWNLFARRDIQSAQLIHATSQLEAVELRDLGLRNPIAVIPNGVENPPDEWLADSKKRQVLFLSRLHPKKGVVELVKAWRSLRPDGWSLVLAGPDEAQMIEKLQLAPSESIRWVGDVEGEVKWRLLSESSLFILPSYSENFGVVVAEALIAGTPVIATHGTPWECLITEKCGWWVEMTTPSIQAVVQEALACSQDELDLMGQRGRMFAQRAFGWQQIASEMASVYQWIMGNGDKPMNIFA